MRSNTLHRNPVIITLNPASPTNGLAEFQEGFHAVSFALAWCKQRRVVVGPPRASLSGGGRCSRNNTLFGYVYLCSTIFGLSIIRVIFSPPLRLLLPETSLLRAARAS
ncbi:hypothetical protein CDAR_298111 [Caerostris darwini]|uniref:Uncharacterized protein n=1 Tax=Caerostris darwini TaxID=1538125 RepID=A0AAV4Q0C8_9ARAC|nr:hypothetical protein CDAR_298111 [Caerostris darwini]